MFTFFPSSLIWEKFMLILTLPTARIFHKSWDRENKGVVKLWIASMMISLLNDPCPLGAQSDVSCVDGSCMRIFCTNKNCYGTRAPKHLQSPSPAGVHDEILLLHLVTG